MPSVMSLFLFLTLGSIFKEKQDEPYIHSHKADEVGYFNQFVVAEVTHLVNIGDI